MTLLGRLAQPFRGYRLLRRVLVELRGIRRALERQADALELAAGTQPRDTVGGQVFRSFAQTKGDLSDREMQVASEVSYVRDAELAAMLDAEDKLRGLLGRDPSPEEIMHAYDGKEP